MRGRPRKKDHHAPACARVPVRKEVNRMEGEKRKSNATPEGRAKGGRNRSRYKAEYAPRLMEYVEECLANEEKPTLFAFMRQIGIYNRNTFTAWAKKHEDFAEAYEMYKEASRDVIVEKALRGTFDARFSKFLLSCDYGMKEKTEVDIGNTGESESFKVNIKVVD